MLMIELDASAVYTARDQLRPRPAVIPAFLRTPTRTVRPAWVAGDPKVGAAGIAKGYWRGRHAGLYPQS
jgi:hypothetical protein